jgi:hypothetical protein
MRRTEITIRPGRVVRWCALAIGLLVAAHGGSQVLRFAFGRDYQLGLAQEVYLGGEATIPNWFSTVLILACAVALLTIARATRGERFHTHWTALGVIFVLMSLDESAALHDLSAPFFYGVFTRLADALGGPFVALANKPGYAWMVPGIVFCVAVAAAYLPFLAALPRRTAAWFVLSGLVYVGGAVGFEAIGGWYSGIHGPRNPTFVAIMTCEETLEMIGMTMFLYTLVVYLESHVGLLSVRFADSALRAPGAVPAPGGQRIRSAATGRAVAGQSRGSTDRT